VTFDMRMSNIKPVSKKIVVANGQSLTLGRSGDLILFSDMNIKAKNSSYRMFLEYGS
jgi:hypothetical protein